MELLRVFTAGNVDEGKSTLIGRLLLDSEAISTDIIQQLTELNGNQSFDLAYLSDGLRAERAMGITIDVAYKYFSTAHRKFILVDTPGHREYTRNMFTGASVCDAAIVLSDVQAPLTEQAIKHLEIIGALGIKHVAFAVNKMDQVHYREEDFMVWSQRMTPWIDKHLSRASVVFLPVSALNGDGIVHQSKNMPWFQGSTLMHWLEHIDVSSVSNDAPFLVEIRGVIGENWVLAKVQSGALSVNETLYCHMGKLPPILEIWEKGVSKNDCSVGQELMFRFAGPINLYRGERLFTCSVPLSSKKWAASVCWMSETEAVLDKIYEFHIGSWTGRGHLSGFEGHFSLNEWRELEITFLEAFIGFKFTVEHQLDRFLIIDLTSNATVAAGILNNLL